LQKEVLTLRDENQRLASENQRLWAWAKENETLREMLAFKTNEVHFRLLAVRVEGRELSNWWNAVIVNRGREDDPALREDLPVVSPRGVVGKTGKVGSRTTQVVLIIDENCRISARTENSRAQGIVQGATTINGGKPECRIQFIARDTKFMVGERVFTTGLGGTFPANLLIGTISEAPDLSANRNFGLYREGVVEPNADMENLEKLFVVLGIK
jgi:rod shape-determining protein MreC